MLLEGVGNAKGAVPVVTDAVDGGAMDADAVVADAVDAFAVNSFAVDALAKTAHPTRRAKL